MTMPKETDAIKYARYQRAVDKAVFKVYLAADKATRESAAIVPFSVAYQSAEESLAGAMVLEGNTATVTVGISNAMAIPDNPANHNYRADAFITLAAVAKVETKKVAGRDSAIVASVTAQINAALIVFKAADKAVRKAFKKSITAESALRRAQDALTRTQVLLAALPQP